MEEIIKKADILIEALPYIQRFKGSTVVIKYSGNLMENETTVKSILLDIIFMSSVGMKPLIIHGGGRFITERLAAEGKETKFIDGLRITDEEAIKIVKEVLLEVNNNLVEQIKKLGGRAKGILPEDELFKVKKAFSKGFDLGFVGEIVQVKRELLEELLNQGFIPVIPPLGLGKDKKLYNLNADTAASEIASDIRAEKLAFITSVKGIMRNPEDTETLIPMLIKEEAEALIEERVISEGMLPKVKAGLRSLGSGVNKVHIVNGRLSHSLLLEIFTDKGIGTEIVLERNKKE
ncbi:MAG: acetylglutamate kinase [Candidatus Omnitrophica bacterium]|nr:acetylglutamate kinase [Candidatus Omnitrophota bacterium]